jgi:hypothetical protein
MSDEYQPIPHTPGDRQPMLADGIYRAIRMDGSGGFEGIPVQDIVARLNAACVGHPTARIPWPHRLLHDAADEIARLRTVLHDDGRPFTQASDA